MVYDLVIANDQLVVLHEITSGPTAHFTVFDLKTGLQTSTCPVAEDIQSLSYPFLTFDSFSNLILLTCFSHVSTYDISDLTNRQNCYVFPKEMMYAKIRVGYDGTFYALSLTSNQLYLL